jgi:tetratricopeptide (TPR) repeat protein
MPQHDSLYETGMDHLQKGEWEAAITVFEDLKRKYPESSLVQQALDEARFKANLGTKRVRGRRWTIRFWPILLRILVIGAIVYLVYQGAMLLRDRVAPVIQTAQERQRVEQLIVEADTFLDADALNEAEERYLAVLEIVPDQERATEALAQIAREREIEALYADARALEEAGELEAALEAYGELSEISPRYRDIARRIEVINRRLDLATLFAAADEDYEAGRAVAAVEAYEEIRARNLNYEQELVEERLYELYLQLGREIIELDPPDIEAFPDAITYFTKAMALRPRSRMAERELQLARLFLEGQDAYYEGRWGDAVLSLMVVYNIRPDYAAGSVLPMLYEAMVRYGDQLRADGDVYLAYEQYRKAGGLPVGDTSFADGRLFYVQPLLTPTATPTPAPTPRPEFAGPPPTPRPLSSYVNKIVFRADYQGSLGEIWMMDPDGSNRIRMGRSPALVQQFEDLEDSETYAPEGDRFAFSQAPPGTQLPEQIFVSIPVDQRSGDVWFTQITRLDARAYDPVWSPDGSRIAFVSPAVDSDDIWVVGADGSNPQPLTPNPWEWDRHPSWSPESDKIIFHSNRSGLLQIYSMNPDGTEVVNISNIEWDVYDPIWIK